MLCVALLIVPMGLLVAVLPTWAEHQHAARVAAREAARIAAHADGPGEAVGGATQMASQVLSNHAVAAHDVLGVGVDVDADGAGRLERGGQVHVEVSVRVPVRGIPLLGDIGGFTWTTGHRERIDDYRSLP